MTILYTKCPATPRFLWIQYATCLCLHEKDFGHLFESQVECGTREREKKKGKDRNNKFC